MQCTSLSSPVSIPLFSTVFSFLRFDPLSTRAHCIALYFIITYTCRTLIINSLYTCTCTLISYVRAGGRDGTGRAIECVFSDGMPLTTRTSACALHIYTVNLFACVRIRICVRICARICRKELGADALELKGELYCVRCHDRYAEKICAACKYALDITTYSTLSTCSAVVDTE